METFALQELLSQLGITFFDWQRLAVKELVYFQQGSHLLTSRDRIYRHQILRL